MAIYLSLLPVSHPHVTLTDVLRVTNAAPPARLASGGKSSPLLERTAASRHPLSCGPRAGQGEGFPPRRAGRPPAAAQCKHLVGPRGALWPLVLPQKGRAATPAGSLPQAQARDRGGRASGPQAKGTCARPEAGSSWTRTLAACPAGRLPDASSRAGWAGSSFTWGCSALGRAPALCSL